MNDEEERPINKIINWESGKSARKKLLIYCFVVGTVAFLVGMQYGTFKGMNYCVNIGLQLFERAGYDIDIASQYLAAGTLKYRGIVEKFTNLTPEQLESWGGR